MKDCTSKLESDNLQSMPDPQPFVIFPKPTQEDNATYFKIFKATTGKEVVTYEPGKWTTQTVAQQELAERTAILFAKCEK